MVAGSGGGSLMSSKCALQEKFQAGKASQRSWGTACGEAAGGSLIHQCLWLFTPAAAMGPEPSGLPAGKAVGRGNSQGLTFLVSEAA